MKPATSKLSCEDVLNAFAVEPSHERATLERYLRDYRSEEHTSELPVT